MPGISRLFVTSSLFYLVLTLAVGVARPFAGRLPESFAAVLGSFPGYVHLWAIGWLTQLIFGIAYWLLPIIDKERKRGPAWPMVASFVCINLGLPVRLLTEPFLHTDTALVVPLYVASAGLLWLSGVLFSIHAWPRIN